MPLTCYFSDLRFEKDAFVTPYVNDKCTNVSERVLNEISLDNEITIAAFFPVNSIYLEPYFCQRVVILIRELSRMVFLAETEKGCFFALLVA